MRKVLLAAALLLAAGGDVLADPPDTAAAEATRPIPRRHIVVISDLHFGLGMTSKGAWDPREDFRWSRALAGFLKSVRKTGADKVDLVIAGDFLELWQPPDDVRCDGADDAKCSVDQLLAITRHVATQHEHDLKLLGDFAAAGDNQLIVVPGNHDAALLVPAVWAEVAKRLGGPTGRVTLHTSDFWSSTDGQVVIEHGHQIGADANAFVGWPDVTKLKGTQQYLQSPWGERFVQKLFNAEEVKYPIIDNLSPESYGARLRMADRGLWRSVGDVARFIAFNLFQTTFSQKMQGLGEDEKAGQPCTKEEAQALGYKLFVAALPDGDPFKAELEGTSAAARSLQRELDQLTKRLSEDELAQICRQRTSRPGLNAALEATFIPREDVLRTHIQQRRQQLPSLKMLVYAHTHQLETAWNLRLQLGDGVSVLNTGAFQRLVNEKGFRKRLDEKRIAKHSEGLRRISLESLAPCYSFVEIEAGDSVSRPVAATRLWRMEESDQEGVPVDLGDVSCE